MLVGRQRSVTWPTGKRFAFTIVDDTDRATVENTSPIYDFLIEHGFLTTKTVWPLAPVQEPRFGGSTLEDPHYRNWVLDLSARGVEIAFHGATDHSARRELVVKALDSFREVLDSDPRLYVVHSGQNEAMYWGDARLDGLARAIYQISNRLIHRRESFQGHVEASPYFWGDVCRARISYVRNLVFKGINTLKLDPMMPCHDPRRPYVRYWFSSSDGGNPTTFCRLLCEANQDRLCEEGGACIVYTHFGNGFTQYGRLDTEFTRLMIRLAGLRGWFVPASRMLDYLKAQPGWRENANPRILSGMQLKWLIAKLSYGRS
jgi:hypothetical protein